MRWFMIALLLGALTACGYTDQELEKARFFCEQEKGGEFVIRVDNDSRVTGTNCRVGKMMYKIADDNRPMFLYDARLDQGY